MCEYFTYFLIKNTYSLTTFNTFSMLFPPSLYQTCTNVPLFLPLFYLLLNNVHSLVSVSTLKLKRIFSHAFTQCLQGLALLPSHIYLSYPHNLMGVDISCYRARVGLFVASYKAKKRLSLIEIICSTACSPITCTYLVQVQSFWN